MIQLLGRPTSINVRKVLWLAAELQLALEHDTAPADVAALRPDLPAVNAWFERLRERPAFRQFGDNGIP